MLLLGERWDVSLTVTLCLVYYREKNYRKLPKGKVNLILSFRIVPEIQRINRLERVKDMRKVGPEERQTFVYFQRERVPKRQKRRVTRRAELED